MGNCPKKINEAKAKSVKCLKGKAFISTLCDSTARQERKRRVILGVRLTAVVDKLTEHPPGGALLLKSDGNACQKLKRRPLM